MTSSSRLPRLRFTPGTQIFLAIVLGIAAGHFIGEPAKLLQPLGDIFMSLIRMCDSGRVCFSRLRHHLAL